MCLGMSIEMPQEFHFMGSCGKCIMVQEMQGKSWAPVSAANLDIPFKSQYIAKTSMADKEMITIPKEEYEELLKLKADLPAMLEKAKEEEQKEALVRLHQRDKENPEGARKRALKRYNRNKDEINAKRREAYKAKKEALKTATD